LKDRRRRRQKRKRRHEREGKGGNCFMSRRYLLEFAKTTNGRTDSGGNSSAERRRKKHNNKEQKVRRWKGETYEGRIQQKEEQNAKRSCINEPQSVSSSGNSLLASTASPDTNNVSLHGVLKHTEKRYREWKNEKGTQRKQNEQSGREMKWSGKVQSFKRMT
jgi:hypothetical protein